MINLVEKQTKELEQYLPDLTKRPDFEAFWERTIQQAKNVPLNAKFEKYDYPSPYVDVYSISYCGFDETEIYGWYLVPTFIKRDKYPCLINYHGFTGSRGKPADFMHWVMMGMAVISVDCRMQGGKTGNKANYSSGLVDSVVTLGILDKEEYYFRGAYMDALKAIDFAESCMEVDKENIVIHGGSQGGALGMAVCSLDNRPKLALVNVPSNSDLETRVENENGSFSAVTNYLRRYPHHLEKAYETLSYFDTMNMADQITCKVYASVALKDNVCPAKCYFASYNRIKSEKEINVYPFNGHDGAYSEQLEYELNVLRKNGIV